MNTTRDEEANWGEAAEQQDRIGQDAWSSPYTSNNNRICQAGNVAIGGNNDLVAVLNPVLDASYTRNLRRSPPNSTCFPGTRKEVLNKICFWVDSSVLLSGFRANPHIMWVYGYTGTGKSAIAQTICEHYAELGRLAGAFFFFRGARDRCDASRFATTVASQMAGAIPATAPLIEAAIHANPGLLSTTTTSLSEQFEQLVFRPIERAVRAVVSLWYGSYLIALDGLDECGDREEVATFIQRMIAFFERNPSIPLRFLITSRVENHIHNRLHSSKQVKLLNLVQHTSDADILTALEVAISVETPSLVLACDESWPSEEDKAKLIKHVGGSFIFLTTIIRLLFDANTYGGLTPMERLPLILSMQPKFDGLYRAILEPSRSLPHFQEILSTIALAQESPSIAQIADLLGIKSAQVANILLNLHAIMQIPGDDRTPVTLWHTSLRDYLCSKERSGPFYAEPAHHQRLAYQCIYLALTPPSMESSTSEYYSKFALEHYEAFMQTIKGDVDACHREMDAIIDHMRGAVSSAKRRHESIVYFRPPSTLDPATWNPLEVLFLADSLDVAQIDLKTSIDVNRPFRDGRTALEIASCTRNWNLVHALLNANADINVRFNAGGTALEMASCAAEWEVVRALVKAPDADVNVRFKSGCTALEMASYAGEWGVVRALVNTPNADVNVRFEDAGDGIVCALHAACYHEQWTLVRSLLESGADTNVVGPARQDRDGFDDGTALAFAAYRRNIILVTRLLEYRADPNLQGGFYGTALQAACERGPLAVVNLLLDHGAHPNADITVLHFTHALGKDMIIMLGLCWFTKQTQTFETMLGVLPCTTPAIEDTEK